MGRKARGMEKRENGFESAEQERGRRIGVPLCAGSSMAGDSNEGGERTQNSPIAEEQ